MGFVPLLAPALAVHPTSLRLPPPDAVTAVLVTSRHALAACLPRFHDARLLVVGDATAARARGLGFNHVISASGDAAALAQLAARALRPADGPVLLATGRGQGGALAVMLRAAGFRVIRRVVYRAAPSRSLPATAAAALRTGQVRAALFFSAETVKSFVRLIRTAGLEETMRHVDALAIGPTAGMALNSLPWRRIGVADKPTQDAMLALLR